MDYLKILDSGACNEAIKGYLIEAMRNADFTPAAICLALQGLRWALDEMDACDAVDNYRRFMKVFEED